MRLVAKVGIVGYATALAGLVSCVGDAGVEGSVTRDSAGVAIVESRAPLWKEGDGWRVAPEPALTIGGVDGRDEELLYDVRGAVRLADGRIVVANAGSAELRFYHPDGSHHFTVGRAGRGPGEFDTIQRLWKLGDSLFVYDFQQGNRVSVFTYAGDLVRTVSLQPTAGGGIPVSADLFPTGEFLVALSSRRSPLPEGFARDTTLFIVYSADGAPGDTVGWLPGSEGYYARISAGVAGVDRPYGLTGQRAVGRTGLYFGSSESYEIGLYGRGGTVLKQLVRRPIPNPRVTDDERLAYEREREKGYARSGPVFRELLDLVELPATKPAYGSMIVDSDENLWVAEYRRSRDDRARWNVFDPDGRWLGHVDTPPGLEIHEIGADYVLGVRKDEVDIEYVELYELMRGAED